jgi:TDG/mug DNA glycosylase family protein
MHVRSFDPVVGSRPRVLILGSMPGVKSLEAGEYYAHPQNAFWRIMEALGVTPADEPYPERLAALKRSGIALWDVLEACERPGSLDTAIVKQSEVPNGITEVLAVHPSIRAVFFNGSKAEQAFRRHVLPALAPTVARLQFVRLPSTSPARAIPFEAKLMAWRHAFDSLDSKHSHERSRQGGRGRRREIDLV